MNKVSFPGLGIDLNINPIAINNLFGFEGFDIPWYAIILTTGVLLAFWLFYYYAVKKEKLPSDNVYDITLIVIPIAMIGARFVYVATNWEYYKTVSFLDKINIRNGGIAIYGAIIFGLITVLVFNLIKKTNPFPMLDALAPAVMLGQVIGRWGNFTNTEAYGWSRGIEKLPWRMWIERVEIDGRYEPGLHLVHPTFLYESLWNAIGLCLIVFLLYRKKKFNGEIFFAYIGWYGLGRAFIEMLRTDSLYIPGTTLKFSVLVGFICVFAAIIGLIILYRRHLDESRELAGYKSQFEAVRISLSNEENALDQSVFETEIEETEENSEEELDEDGDFDEETLKEQDLLDGDPCEEDEIDEVQE